MLVLHTQDARTALTLAAAGWTGVQCMQLATYHMTHSIPMQTAMLLMSRCSGVFTVFVTEPSMTMSTSLRLLVLACVPVGCAHNSWSVNGCQWLSMVSYGING